MPPAVLGPQLIGLCGAAGSGKSTVAAILEQWGYTRLRFAGPLKNMLAVLLAAGGVDHPTQRRMLEGDLKELPHPILQGQSPRRAMQTLGTEWGRECIGPDFWVGITAARADALLAEGRCVVIEDVRFPNEAAMVKGTGVATKHTRRELWQLAGRGGIQGDHPSEGQDLQPDMVLHNTGSLERLEAEVLAEILG